MRWIKGLLRGIIMTVLLLLSAVLFYILVIMGDSGTPNNGYGANPTPVAYQIERRQAVIASGGLRALGP